MIKTHDPWVADTVGLEVDYLQVLDASNTVVKEYHFGGNVFMEQTGSYYDYGMLRKPNMVSWGTQDYPDDSGGQPEKDLSQSVSAYVVNRFSGTGRYVATDNWGANTEPNLVYDKIRESEQVYDYTSVFYKGHFWRTMTSGNCDSQDCTWLHWGIVDDEGYAVTPAEAMKDYAIHNQVNEGKNNAHKTRGTTDFIFIWSCVNADSDVTRDQVGQITGSHSYGMLASWMDIDNPRIQFEEYGYAFPDDSDHVYIGFSWISPCYIYYGQLENRYLWQFVEQFYYYALVHGYTVHDSLDAASRYINGPSVPFGSSNLYNNQTVWNLQAQPPRWEYTQMRVWGDSNHKMPR